MTIIKRPWNLFDLKSDINTVFNSFFDENEKNAAGPSWTPRVDLSDDKDNYHISIELPGIDKKDIKINVKNHSLSVRGEKKREKKNKDENMYQSERTFGKFSRFFNLPESVDENKIEAKYEDGVLDLLIPKKEEAKPKEIDIKIS